MKSKKPIAENHTSALQEKDGVDLSQLMRNLTLTPEQRLTEHQAALDLVLELQRAGIKLREQSQ